MWLNFVVYIVGIKMATIADLTVVIASKDRDENLSLCLSSIAQTNPKPNGIYVVDFGSAVSLRNKYKDYFPYVVVIRANNNTKFFHKARAINIGLKAVRTKYVCFTDTDQIFAPDVFGVIATSCKSCISPFIYSGTYFIKSEIPNGINSLNISTRYNELLTLAQSESRQYGDGCLHVVPTAYAKSIGGYEEGFLGWGPEDSDFRRMAKANKLQFIDITTKTTMIHLPHSKSGSYYGKDIYKRNLELYYQRRRICACRSNGGCLWGQR